MRLENIDLFKGVLIFLVLLGHVLPGEMNESLSRTVIYSFHMPLFIGISGFLFNLNTLASLSFTEFFNKYKFRIITPWLVAILVYFLINIPSLQYINLTNLKLQLERPYFHLWFIPAFISWMLITIGLKKLKCTDRTILIIAFVISLFAKICITYPAIYQLTLKTNMLGSIWIDVYRPQFYFFFVLGIFIKNQTLLRPLKIEYWAAILFSVSVPYLFYFPNKVVFIAIYFLLNITLLVLLLKVSVHRMIPSVPSIQWMGVHSLAIYLWHMAPILLIKKIYPFENGVNYYVMILLGELLAFFLYVVLLKIPFFKKYIFGL